MPYSSPSYSATILVIIFFRNVGIIGAKGGGARGASRPAPQPDDDKSTTQSSLTVAQSEEEKMSNSP